jgi:hypothetical protein
MHAPISDRVIVCQWPSCKTAAAAAAVDAAAAAAAQGELPPDSAGAAAGAQERRGSGVKAATSARQVGFGLTDGLDSIPVIKAGGLFSTSTRPTLNLLLLLRPSVWAFTLNVCHALMGFECMFSMTLLQE